MQLNDRAVEKRGGIGCENRDEDLKQRETWEVRRGGGTRRQGSIGGTIWAFNGVEANESREGTRGALTDW